MDSTAAVGVSALYSREDHVHPSDISRAPLASPAFTGNPTAPTPAAGDNDTSIATTAFVGAAVTNAAVRYDASQTLTSAQLVQARQNIYAAPFDALAYNGMQVNGSMEVSQELGASGRSTNGFICDGWQVGFSGTMVVLAKRSLLAGTFPGLPYFINISVSTAQASLGTLDSSTIFHGIEGWRIARLEWGSSNAQSITIGFWTSHHRTGLYSGSVRNGATTRSYVFTYTQNVADIAQYNTITIPGDTAGTWNIDNTAGLYLTFAFAAGSSTTAPSINGWLAGSFSAAPGQVNGVAAITDVFRVTGVIVLPGIEAPSALRSPFIMRPFDQELPICQRYWQKSYNYSVAPGTVGSSGCSANFITGLASGTNSGGHAVRFARTMRATPTLTAYSPVSGASGKLADIGSIMDVTPVIDLIGDGGFRWYAAAAAAQSSLNMTMHWTADARL